MYRSLALLSYDRHLLMTLELRNVKGTEVMPNNNGVPNEFDAVPELRSPQSGGIAETSYCHFSLPFGRERSFV